MLDLPFSQAAENNRGPILDQLRLILKDARTVLEIGAGTGQHASFFAAHMPWLSWQPSEYPAAVELLLPRCRQADLGNLAKPLALDICTGPWPEDWPDALYTANTLHIVATDAVESLFDTCAERAAANSQLLVYGPFNYADRYTSESNARFDEWLKARDARSGIRDIEWVDGLASAAGYTLEQDIAMPANNRLLQWRRRA